jgi:hypothetical protein
MQYSRSDNPNCSPSDQMLVAGVDCDYLANYGSNTIGMIILLVFMIIVDAVYYWLYKAKPSTIYNIENFPHNDRSIFHQVSRVAVIILKTFGMRFFIAKMDGIMMESIFYASVNILTLNSSQMLGFTVSIVCIVYFSVQMIAIIIIGRKYLNMIALDKRDRTAMGEIDFTIAYPLSPNTYIDKTFNILFQGMRADLGNTAVHFILINGMRSILLAIVVGFLMKPTLLPIVVVIIIASIFLLTSWYFTKLKTRVSKIQRIVDFSGPIFNIKFYTLSGVSLSSSLRTSLALDAILLATLLSYCLFNVFVTLFALVSLAISIVQYFKHGVQIRKGKYYSQATRPCTPYALRGSSCP